MQIFNLTTFSKNKKSLKGFLNFFQKHLTSNFYCVKKKFLKKKKKKVITLLASPHVNKNAQEQFEIRNWGAQFTVHVTQPLKLLVFIKKLKTTLFPDLSFKLKNFCSEIKQKSVKKEFFNLDTHNFSKNKNPKNDKKRSHSGNLNTIVKRNVMVLEILELFGK